MFSALEFNITKVFRLTQSEVDLACRTPLNGKQKEEEKSH